MGNSPCSTLQGIPSVFLSLLSSSLEPGKDNSAAHPLWISDCWNCCEQFLQMPHYQILFKLVPFENSSLGRRESKRGGEEETREMLVAGFVLVPPRFLLSGSLSMVLSNYSSAVFNTRYYCSISDGKRGWKGIWCYLSHCRKSPHSHSADLEQGVSVLLRTL